MKPRTVSTPSIPRRLRVALGSPAFAIAVIAVGFGLVAALIVASPYASDDLINRTVRADMAAAGIPLWQLIADQTSGWVQVNGRLFPGSLAWSYSLFWVFDTRVEYKLVLAIVLAAAGIAVASFAWILARNRRVAVVAAIALIGAIQLRVGYDGLTSFTGLLPLTTALSVGACVLAIRHRGWAWSSLAALMYLAALLTYETVLLFAPAMVVAIVFATRSWLRALPVAVPALMALIWVIALRAVYGQTPGPGYTVSLDPIVVFSTTVKQFLSALPLSQWWLGSNPMPPISATMLLVSATLVGIPVFLLAHRLAGVRTAMVRRSWIVVMGFGLWIWASSSALIGVTARWQDELILGQGYLAVIYGYFGVALVITAGWIAGTHGAHRLGSARRVAAWAVGSASVLAAICTLTVAGNLAIAATYWGQ